MAKNDKKNEAPKADVFDYAKYMPEGYSADELKVTGGLTPIYAPEHVLENAFPVCAGWMSNIELLPEVQQGRDERGNPRVYIPMMIRVVCTAPTKGILGKKEDMKIVDVAVGEDILVPVTGNIRANKAILSAVPGCRPHKDLPAAIDPSKVFFGIFRLLGTKDTGQPSEMWDWESTIHPKAQVRSTFMKGRFVLIEGPAAVPQLPAGIVNSATGEIVERVVSQPAS